MDITNKQWKQAQIEERRFHTDPFEVGYKKYMHSYQQYFNHCGIDKDLDGKTILEVGPADYPALAYCRNYGKSYIIEPMPSSHLETLTANKSIELIKHKAEDLVFPKVDEVWFFNVLQHVQDPEQIIKNAMSAAGVIRFFEPINYPVDTAHLHEFSIEYFQSYFGDCVKLYRGNPNAINFHTWQCAYGVWQLETKN